MLLGSFFGKWTGSEHLQLSRKLVSQFAVTFIRFSLQKLDWQLWSIFRYWFLSCRNIEFVRNNSNCLFIGLPKWTACSYCKRHIWANFIVQLMKEPFQPFQVSHIVYNWTFPSKWGFWWTFYRKTVNLSFCIKKYTII